jgi:hypothetical protein
MTSPDDVPYADPESLPELIDECRCAQAECAAHRVDLPPEAHRLVAHPVPMAIDEPTRHLVDGYSDYGG